MPEYEVDFAFRPKSGNEAVIVLGDVYIAAQERINSWDLDLKTIKVLLLTPVSGKLNQVFPTKYVYKKGEPDNWATVYLWDHDGTEHSGSVWLNFMVLGE